MGTAEASCLGDCSCDTFNGICKLFRLEMSKLFGGFRNVVIINLGPLFLRFTLGSSDLLGECMYFLVLLFSILAFDSLDVVLYDTQSE